MSGWDWGVLAAALVAEGLVIACFRLTNISFLWYNVVGCVSVLALAAVFALLPGLPRALTRPEPRT